MGTSVRCFLLIRSAPLSCVQMPQILAQHTWTRSRGAVSWHSHSK